MMKTKAFLALSLVTVLVFTPRLNASNSIDSSTSTLPQDQLRFPSPGNVLLEGSASEHISAKEGASNDGVAYRNFDFKLKVSHTNRWAYVLPLGIAQDISESALEQAHVSWYIGLSHRKGEWGLSPAFESQYRGLWGLRWPMDVGLKLSSFVPLQKSGWLWSGDVLIGPYFSLGRSDELMFKVGVSYWDSLLQQIPGVNSETFRWTFPVSLRWTHRIYSQQALWTEYSYRGLGASPDLHRHQGTFGISQTW